MYRRGVLPSTGGRSVRLSQQLLPTGRSERSQRFSFGQNLRLISLTTLPLNPAEAGSKFEDEEMGSGGGKYCS